MRTTVDIADPILKDLKRLQKQEAKSLGALVSELLQSALQKRKTVPKAAFKLRPRKMGRPLVDLLDREAVQAVLDEQAGWGRR